MLRPFYIALAIFCINNMRNTNNQNQLLV